MSVLSLVGAVIAPAHTSVPVLECVDLTIASGERLALIGPNGSGKSTLLAALAGDLELFAGRRDSGRHCQVAFAQRDEPECGECVRDALLAHVVTTGDEWDLEARMWRVLAGLGAALGEVALDSPLAELSGGQRQRVRLAAVLLADADVVLLDEPTDDLDIEAARWLECHLLRSDRAVVIASHDRALLERWPTRIASIDPHAKRLQVGSGPLDVFEAAASKRAVQAERDHANTERRYATAERAAAARAAKAATMTRARNVGDGFDRNAKAWYNERAGGLARASRVLREREERNRTERPHRAKQVAGRRLTPTGSDRASGVVAYLDALSVGYADVVVAGPFTTGVERGEHVAFTGGNGVGKTTLLRTIVGSLEPIAGAVSVGGSRLAVLEQDVPAELLGLTPLQVIDDRVVEAYRGDAALMLGALLVRGRDLQRAVGELSAGSRRKVLLACLLASRADLLVLDEPANHLDLQSRDALADALAATSSAIVFTSHDRSLLEHVATREVPVDVVGTRE